MRITARIATGACAALAAAALTAAAAESTRPVLALRGYALNLTGVGQGRSGDLQVAIDRWSSDADRDRLRRATADGGIAGLSRAIAELSTRVGTVTTERGGTLNLKFAHRSALPDGGTRVVLVTDPLGAPADGTNPRADTYDFLAVEVRLDKAGKGEGRTAGPQRLRYNSDTGTLELDRYRAEPVWIKDVRVVDATVPPARP
jgi:hypothetical protein